MCDFRTEHVFNSCVGVFVKATDCIIIIQLYKLYLQRWSQVRYPKHAIQLKMLYIVSLLL